ncbi:hypothetical protein QEZ40_003015 [Streptomyces katrae]|uniref:AAA+ ATPase domain-containing protein n=1 Tax=Streptomyces katrae TaxID=68223 RepID=A0ABT7GWT8_9ACTN|nr:hypothetical protein [Streptomyces katrae]MDK9498067.1 hypothetical protein [Streptomyces katrae]
MDTVRGIAYQQAQGVLAALEVLDDPELGSVRVEGADDVVDIELFARGGSLRRAAQVKIRTDRNTWGRQELLVVFRRWAELPGASGASFEFVTNGRLGPSGDLVAEALDAAGAGDFGPLAGMLGGDLGAPECEALATARIRQDLRSTVALLAQAERQVVAMLPHVRTDADAREQARHAVDRLFLELFERAGLVDPDDRVLRREEIAGLLGVPPEQSAHQRWPGPVRNRYLRAAAASSPGSRIPAVVVRSPAEGLSVRRLDGQVPERSRPVTALLEGPGPVVLTGRTGTGKTTAADLLRTEAARRGRVVVVAHAEAYLPGRLTTLVADGLSAVLDEVMPLATGAQVLSDSDVTLVIDGVSEVADDVRQELRNELLAQVAAGRGARVVLIGRDVAALRATLPSSVQPACYQVSPLDEDRKMDLLSVLRPTGAEDDNGGPAARTMLAQLERALGDASDSPLLFSMGLTLLAEGVRFADRAGLYGAFVERLAGRAGAVGITMVSRVLGVAYAGLLDRGRRHADPFEWFGLLERAAGSLGAVGATFHVRELDSTARRCGLVTPIGWDQTLVPVHDSFADYLAGAAHAHHLAPLPSRLRQGDDQRVLFAAEIGGVGAELAERVVRDLPFTAVPLSGLDDRALSHGSPGEVAALLGHLDAGPPRGVALWRMRDGRVVALRTAPGDAGWIDEPAARSLLRTTAGTVVAPDAGPLAVAVRLWRQVLLERLRTPPVLPPPRCDTVEEACTMLEEHAGRSAAAVSRLLAAVSPPGHRGLLEAQLGPTGLRAVVGSRASGPWGDHWPVDFVPDAEVVVLAAAGSSREDSPLRGHGGRSSVEVILDKGAAAEAAERVRSALKTLTGDHSFPS